MAECTDPTTERPKSNTQAVTPDPHELMTGKVVSIPLARKILESSMSVFKHPVTSSISSLNGRFVLPVIWPDLTPFLGSGTSPLNRAAPRASRI